MCGNQVAVASNRWWLALPQSPSSEQSSLVPTRPLKRFSKLGDYYCGPQIRQTGMVAMSSRTDNGCDGAPKACRFVSARRFPEEGRFANYSVSFTRIAIARLWRRMSDSGRCCWSRAPSSRCFTYLFNYRANHGWTLATYGQTTYVVWSRCGERIAASIYFVVPIFYLYPPWYRSASDVDCGCDGHTRNRVRRGASDRWHENVTHATIWNRRLRLPYGVQKWFTNHRGSGFQCVFQKECLATSLTEPHRSRQDKPAA
jgi:hypothetical protein